MRLIAKISLFLISGLLYTPLISSQWQPGQQYDLNEEKYTYRVLWETDQAHYGDIHINEYRGQRHIVASYAGNSYIVYIDYDWRPRIVKVSSDGTAAEAFLDSADYHILENDSHQYFAIGIDKDGYIHVFGDMHNFPRYHIDHLPERYQNAECMYWRSDLPEDISGFTWHGDQFGNCPWGTSFTYPQFFYDQNGGIYFSTRVRSETERQYAAVNYNKYNTETRQWELIGGTNEYNNQCLFWEDNGEGGGTYSKPCRNLHFDLNNTAHFVSSLYNSDRDKPFPETNGKYNTDVVYAASDDFGMTFRRANGTAVEAIPMRIDVAAQRPDLILSNTIVGATVSEAITDYKGTPYVLGDEYAEDGTLTHFCYAFNSETDAWEDVSALRPPSKGYFVADRAGVITFFTKGTYAMHRFFEFGKARITNMPYYDIGVDRLHMLETGHIRGIQRRTNASQLFQLVEVEIERPISYPEMGDVLSSDAQLWSLEADAGIFYPEFSPARYRYTLYVPEGTQGVILTAISKHHKALVSGDGEQTIPQMALISVMAEDSTTVLNYEVNIVETDIDAFLPAGDAYVRSGDYSSYNYNEDEIRCKTASNANFRREGLMKFSVEGINAEEINAVFLKLHINKVNGSTRAQFYDCDTDWDETTITWESASLLPIADEPFRKYDISPGNDSSFILVNITGYVKEQLSTDTVFGFRMISEVTGTDFRLSSKEHTDSLKIPEICIMYGASLSDETSLQSLISDIGNLDPAFDANILDYSLEVPVGTEQVHLAAIASHPVAWVTGDGLIKTKTGQAIITVTAEDGVTVREYTVDIYGHNTAVTKSGQDVNFKFYPNPASDHIRVEFSERMIGSITLRNILGQVLIKQEISSEKEILNLSSIRSGIYFLSVESGDGIVNTQKLIVK